MQICYSSRFSWTLVRFCNRLNICARQKVTRPYFLVLGNLADGLCGRIRGLYSRPMSFQLKIFLFMAKQEKYDSLKVICELVWTIWSELESNSIMDMFSISLASFFDEQNFLQAFKSLLVLSWEPFSGLENTLRFWFGVLIAWVELAFKKICSTCTPFPLLLLGSLFSIFSRDRQDFVSFACNFLSAKVPESRAI